MDRFQRTERFDPLRRKSEAALRVLQADFGQRFSQPKLQRVLTYPITGWSGLKAFLSPFLIPVLVVAITWIPLDPPAKGFQGRNLFLIFVGTSAAIIMAYGIDTRLQSLLPDTTLTKRQRQVCAALLIFVSVTCACLGWSLIAFPFPFCTYG